MVSRALRTATVTLLVGCLTAAAVHAVENLEAGKSPSQIFAGTCSACHRSPRGLLKTVPASSLQGFLRQHYTTSSDMASVLSSFLISNGATDTRYQGKDQPKNDLAKQRDARQDPRSEGRPDQPDRPGRRQRPAAHETSPPEADGAVAPQGEGGRPSREARRHTRQGQTPDGARPADGQTPAQAATDSRPHTKQRLGKRGKRPAEEPPKSEEPAKGDAAKDDVSRDAARPETETAKTDAGKSDAAKSDAAKPEAMILTPLPLLHRLRADGADRGRRGSHRLHDRRGSRPRDHHGSRLRGHRGNRRRDRRARGHDRPCASSRTDLPRALRRGR